MGKCIENELKSLPLITQLANTSEDFEPWNLLIDELRYIGVGNRSKVLITTLEGIASQSDLINTFEEIIGNDILGCLGYFNSLAESKDLHPESGFPDSYTDFKKRVLKLLNRVEDKNKAVLEIFRLANIAGNNTIGFHLLTSLNTIDC